MKSMTGYGAAAGKVGRGRLYIELKTTNHRYCDISLRIPPRMGSLEANLKEHLQKRLSRGKIELFLRELTPVFGEAELVLDVELARRYQKAITRLQKSLKLVSNADLLSLMGVEPFIHTQEKEGNYLSHWRDIQKLLFQLINQVEKMRMKEGAHITADQKKRLKMLRHLLDKIEKRSLQNSKQRRNVFVSNPGNGNMETNLSVDKMDITEEVIRLKSHTKQYEGLFLAKEPVGRKLDFLIQEMHREINTIGAKANDADISSCVVDGKSLIENLREQVQNIE